MMAKRLIVAHEPNAAHTIPTIPILFDHNNIPQSWTCMWRGNVYNNSDKELQSQIEIELSFTDVNKKDFIGIEITGKGELFQTEHIINGRIHKDSQVILHVCSHDNIDGQFWILQGCLTSTHSRCLKISGSLSHSNSNEPQQYFSIMSICPPQSQEIVYDTGTFSPQAFPPLQKKPVHKEPVHKQQERLFSPGVPNKLNLPGPLDTRNLSPEFMIPMPQEWTSPWWGYVFDENNRSWEIKFLLTFIRIAQFKFNIWGMGKIKDEEYALRGQLRPNNSFVVAVCQPEKEDNIITHMYGISQPLIPGRQMKINGNFVNIERNSIFGNCVFDMQSQVAPIQNIL